MKDFGRTDFTDNRQFSRVVVISDCAPVDIVFIDELRKRLAGVTVIRTVGSTRRKPVKTSAANSENLIARLERRYSRFLVPSATLDLLRELPVFEISEDDLNDSRGHDLIRELETDVLITRRTCILKESLFTIPALALNIHQGLAPQYRGNHTLFWALYKGDAAAVATTVHRLAPGIDDGDIYGIARPYIHPLRSEAALSIEMMKLSVDIIERLLSKAEREGRVPEGKKQREKGKLYLDRHRTPRRDLDYFLWRKWRFSARRWGDSKIEVYF